MTDTNRYADRVQELRERIYDRFVDGDVIAGPDGALTILVDVAVETTLDLMTDGDNNAFFNRCPACDCGCSGEANSSDCACWCHDPADGWKVWQERTAEADEALADLVTTVDLFAAEMVGTEELTASVAKARRLLDEHRGSNGTN